MLTSVHLEIGEAWKAAQSRPTEGPLYEVEMKDDGVMEKANMSVMWKLDFWVRRKECHKEV